MDQLDELFKNSITQHAPLLFKTSFQGGPMDELAIWSFFNENNLIEKKDKQEFKNFIKKGVKLSILSVIIAIVANRGLSMIKIKNRQFLNLHFILRFPIRISLFGISWYFACFNPMLLNLFKLRDYMTHKYSPRYQRFNEVGDPSLMNPGFINDPTLNAEERETQRFLYDKVRSRQMEIIMKSKEMEMMMKMQKKL